MKANFTKIVFGIIVIMVCIAAQSCQGGTADTAIYIGAVAPQSGDQAQVGQDAVRGVELAIAKINADGGLLGKEVKILSLDDKADPKEASNAASKLVADAKVMGVIGHLNSGCSIPASVIYHRANLAMLTAASTADDLTAQGYDEVFRVVLRDSDQGPAAAKFAKEKLGATSVAVIDDKTAYGKGLAEAFKKEAISLGLQVVATEAFNVADKDFSTLVTKLISANADVVYMGGMFTEGALILKQGRARGLTSHFMSGDGCFAPKLIELGGDAVEGAIISFLAPPWDETPSAMDFLKAYKEKYNEDVKSFAPLAYDATMVLAEAIKKTGKLDRAAIVATLHSPEFKYAGIAATYQFDAHGDITNKQPFFYMVKGGKFVPYRDEPAIPMEAIPQPQLDE